MAHNVIGTCAGLDPGAVILSGSLPRQVLEVLGQHLQQPARWSSALDSLRLPQVHVSRLGGSAVSVGAALLPIHKLGADAIA